MAKLLYYLASAAYFTADSHQPQLHTQTSFFQVLLLLDLSHSFFSFSAIHHLPFLYLHVCMCAELLQLCPTLCDPMDCSPPGSSVRGIFQARILEWAAISFPHSLVKLLFLKIKQKIISLGEDTEKSELLCIADRNVK